MYCLKITVALALAYSTVGCQYFKPEVRDYRTKGGKAQIKTVDSNPQVEEEAPPVIEEVLPVTVDPPVQLSCAAKNLPLKLIIAVDISSTMAATFAATQDALIEFLEGVENLKPEAEGVLSPAVEVGLVFFADNPGIRGYVPLSSGIFVLQTALSEAYTFEDPENTDAAEESLLAARFSMEQLIAANTEKTAKPVLLVVTDNFGHYGGELASRSFAVDQLTALAANEELKDLRIFDATPAAPVQTVVETELFPSPKAQWDAVRSGWTSKYPEQKHGSNISLPVTTAALAEALCE